MEQSSYIHRHTACMGSPIEGRQERSLTGHEQKKRMLCELFQNAGKRLQMVFEGIKFETR